MVDEVVTAKVTDVFIGTNSIAAKKSDLIKDISLQSDFFT